MAIHGERELETALNTGIGERDDWWCQAWWKTLVSHVCFVSYKCSPKVSHKRVSSTSVPQECHLKVSFKSIFEECQERVSNYVWPFVCLRTAFGFVGVYAGIILFTLVYLLLGWRPHI